MNKTKRTGLKSVPSQVQLPGGIVLKGVPFKIVEYNVDGTPKLFELLAPGVHDPKTDGLCTLFAHEEWIRSPVPGKAERLAGVTLNQPGTLTVAALREAAESMYRTGARADELGPVCEHELYKSRCQKCSGAPPLDAST